MTALALAYAAESTRYDGPVIEPLFSSAEVCRRTGVTYRQLDYWARCGAVVPVQETRGSGTARRFSLGQVRAVRLLWVLAEHGARVPILAKVFASASAWPAPLWIGRVVVTREGELYPVEGAPDGVSGWILDLDRAREDVDGRTLVEV